MIRLFLLLFVLVIGAVITLIGFDWIHANDVRLFGWCGLGFIAVAVVGLLSREP